MDSPEIQPAGAAEQDSPARSWRARRAVGLITVSVVVIAVTGLAYVRPTFGVAGAPVTPPSPAPYQLSGVDFVSPTTGWFVAQFDSGRFALLHTTDSARSWTSQLAGDTNERGVYMRFFDSAHGVFALVGNQPMTFRTADGGRTWSSRRTINSSAYVQSVSFIDPQNGWSLARYETGSGPVELFRTRDAGATWSNLGTPVAAGDEPYRVQFTDRTVGWLDTVSVRPHAYKSIDGGLSWSQVPLPAPGGGWPGTGEFFVAAQPTQGPGVVATVVNFVPYVGRSGIGAHVIAFPPLTVRAIYAVDLRSGEVQQTTG